MHRSEEQTVCSLRLSEVWSGSCRVDLGAIGKAKHTGDQRQTTEQDLGPKTGDRRLGTEEEQSTT